MRGRDVPPSPDVQARHAQLIDDNWSSILTIALTEYEAQGRGAVLIDLTGQLAPGAEGIACQYVTDVIMQSLMGDWPTAQLATWVQQYDPENEVIIMIFNRDTTIAGYKYGRSSPPRVLSA